MNVQRAYSLFTVKAMDENRRTFSGWATTPALDRTGDTIDPLGVRFSNPLALLHQHAHDAPIGLVEFQTPTAKGIEFEAEIPIVSEPGLLKDRVDLAWGELKYNLVRAVSIGFRAISWERSAEGGFDFQEIEVYELSTVTIPALPEAVITQVRSMSSGPIDRSVIDTIKSLDWGRRKSGPVQLITPDKPNLNGAVRLIRP